MKLLSAFAVALLGLTGSAQANESVSFLLNWVAGGDHAPYYYAQKMGWYKDAGIDLTLVNEVAGEHGAASDGKVSRVDKVKGAGAGVDRLSLHLHLNVVHTNRRPCVVERYGGDAG